MAQELGRSQAAEFISEKVDKNLPLLDIGAYASEVLCVLRRMGIGRLHGVDLDPGLRKAAERMRIECQIGDFYGSPYPDGSFAAATPISVIEHGYREVELCREVSRLLNPGGYFVASLWRNKDLVLCRRADPGCSLLGCCRDRALAYAGPGRRRRKFVAGPQHLWGSVPRRVTRDARGEKHGGNRSPQVTRPSKSGRVASLQGRLTGTHMPAWMDRDGLGGFAL